MALAAHRSRSARTGLISLSQSKRKVSERITVIACFGDPAREESAGAVPLAAQPAASMASNGQATPEHALICRPHMAEFWSGFFSQGIRIYHRLVAGRVGDYRQSGLLLASPQTSGSCVSSGVSVFRSDERQSLDGLFQLIFVRC